MTTIGQGRRLYELHTKVIDIQPCKSFTINCSGAREVPTISCECYMKESGDTLVEQTEVKRGRIVFDEEEARVLSDDKR